MDEKGEQFYEYVKSKKIEVPNSYKEFQSAMQDSEMANQFYNFVKSKGIEVPDKSEDFQSVFLIQENGKEGKPVNFTPASSEPSEEVTTEQSQDGTPSPIVEQELPVGVINKNKVLPYDKNVDKTTVGTPSPSLLGAVRGATIGSNEGTISFADFEVENPIDTTVDVSTIDIGKYNKQYKPRTSKTNFSKMEEIPSNKEYKPRTSEINFPKMEEIPSMKNGITQNVRDVFTPANTTTTKPIIKEEKIKKISEVAKNIDNEEDYSMFTESLSYIDGLLNSTIAESDKFRLRGSAAFEEISDMILEKGEQLKAKAKQEKKYYGNLISRAREIDFEDIPSYVNRVITKYGVRNQVVDGIVPFRDVERSTQPIDVSQINTETVQDTIATNTQIFSSVPDYFWRSMLNLDLKGNKKDSDIEYNLNVFRNVFDAANGFTYAPIPAKGNTEAPEKLEGISGAVHFFIWDGRPKDHKDVFDATNEDFKKQSVWFKAGGYSTELGYNTSNFKKLKNDQYVPVFKKTESGDLRVSYKKKGDVTENDYVTQNLDQYKYGEIDWVKKTTDKQYKKINVLSTKEGKPIPNLPVLDGETADGKFVKGEDLYSRFSGSATVFLFEKDGKLIADDFSGSTNNIKAEAERISKDYDVPLNAITLGFYDSGSYSAKPAENSDGVLDRRQFYDYNDKLESGSGIGFKK